MVSFAPLRFPREESDQSQTDSSFYTDLKWEKYKLASRMLGQNIFIYKNGLALMGLDELTFFCHA